ncbi:MAG: acetolactate synthase large subunit [Alphaproteobacteria bacterium]|jgi:acetolactate synthase I/II/III large subunit|nr:acetolactate synthase large subunit [Rhodospirillaceae bacterium]MBT7613400.1 acetolactate synthase large subunit [Rhodospirillaceae bacterium]MDG2483190.1 acetolactate synthase large subunit [Alphaproteobacteria bacterium]
MKASDLFVQCLEAEGVERIFGVPGEENADLMMSLENSKIEFVLCRHEQAAAFMADGYGRLTGKAGVCLSTLGPGATNLVTGLADANMDRAPTVAIIGQGSTRRLHKESHQNMDAIEMLRPVSKWAFSVHRGDAIPEMVRKAFKIAEQEKPGVTVLELPEDVAKEDVAREPIPSHKTRRAAADHKAVKAAVEAIVHAKNPVILSGNGALRKRAAKQLRRLATKTGIAAINTFMGKGAISRQDPHCLFTIGLQQRDHANAALDAADVVIAVGYDLVEYAPSHWNKRGGKTIIHIDFEPAEVDEDYDVDVEVVADIADALWQINERINDEYEAKLPLFDINERQALRQTIHDDLHAHENDDSFPMKPQKILNDVRAFLDPEDILLSDVGAHKMWVSRYYQCDEPNTCLISNGFCSMGFAFPASMGAKYAFPDRRILSVCGDAGFLMNVQDLETAVRKRLNVVSLILLDGEYGLIKWKQQNQFDGHHSDLAFNNPDFAMLAQSFGAWSKVLTAPEQLTPALEEAFAQEGPALIAVPVDYAENRKLTKRLGDLQFTI